jgi:nucleotide-binding universal stress UspA family protein
MIRKILTPLDGSAFAEHALPLALCLARRADAALRLIHVLPPVSAVSGEAALHREDFSLEEHLRERQRVAAEAYLSAVCRRVAASGDVKPSVVPAEGDVAAVLRAVVAAEKADLVVMATHGRGALGRLWLGSVADELARTSPAPVLLVRCDEDQPDLSREPPLTRVLIPLDGTALAEQALEPAAALARAAGAEVTVMRVVKPVLPRDYLGEGGVAGLTNALAKIEARQERLRAQAATYLDETAAKLRAAGLAVRTEVAVEERPAQAILETARRGFDLIALGTHGRRGLARLLLGSVADKVLRGADVPVLLHRPRPA